MESSIFRNIFADGFADGIAKGKAEGEAEGEAKAVIRLLMLRLGHLPAEAQQVIHQQAKTDPAVLSVWFDEAALAADGEAARRLLRKIMAT